MTKKIIFYSLFFFAFYSRAQYVEWQHHVSLETVSLPGDKTSFSLKFPPTVDTVITAGAAVFRHADINYLGDSRYVQFFIDTIVTQVELETNGKEGYNRLKSYFERMTNGTSTTFVANDAPVQISVITKDDQQMFVTLFTSKRHKRNRIIMKLMPS